MEWFRQLGRASRALAHMARQNPVWAVQGLVFGPFRIAKHLLGVLALTVAVAVVLILGLDALILYGGLKSHPTLVGLLWIPIWLAILLVPLRALFQPMILRYGSATQADTHGTARFATDAEARSLTGDTGLLIGRDRRSGKLLRYPGPAHLLTIAPTRSGKGVGTIIPNLLEYPFAVVCIVPRARTPASPPANAASSARSTSSTRSVSPAWRRPGSTRSIASTRPASMSPTTA